MVRRLEAGGVTRRTFLGLAALAAAGVAGIASGVRPGRARAGGAGAEGLLRLRGRFSSIRFDFHSARDRESWGRRWLPLHYRRRVDVRRGAARLVLPKGLATTAPTQPVPVFLTDCDARRGTQTVTFTTSNATLRPGVLLDRKSVV